MDFQFYKMVGSLFWIQCCSYESFVEKIFQSVKGTLNKFQAVPRIDIHLKRFGMWLFAFEHLKKIVIQMNYFGSLIAVMKC